MNINPSDIATGLLGLGVIAGAVGLVALGGRDRDADQHDVADYRPEPASFSFELAERGQRQMRKELAPSRRDWPLVNTDRWDVRTTVEWLPPVPAGVRVPLTLYAEQVVAEQLRARYGTTNPVQIAGQMLREIAAEQSDLIWTSTADRDMTGAFPVVAVAR